MDVKISLPLLPLRDIVVFPSMVIPLFVGRDKSISALNEVMKKDKKIILVTQKNSEIDDPKKTDIFMYGCEGNILQLLKLPDGTVKVLVEGIKRVKILDFKDNEKFITCEFSHYNDILTKDEDLYPLAAPNLSRSYLGMAVCIISTAQQARPKVIQCKDPDLDQFTKFSNEVVINPFLPKSSASCLNSSGTLSNLLFILKKFYSQSNAPFFHS